VTGLEANDMLEVRPSCSIAAAIASAACFASMPPECATTGTLNVFRA
jgi:hypothetical protein